MAKAQREMPRRDFLGLAGLALAAAARPAQLDPGRKVRIGVVGGGFGASFQWHLDPNCIVEAVSDLRPERLEHLIGVPAPLVADRRVVPHPHGYGHGIHS